MKESEILALVHARNLIRKIERQGGLCQGGEQSPNSIECIETANDIDRVLPKDVVADPHYGCVGMCCANKKKRKNREDSMKERIVQLENRLQRRVQGVAFGAFYREFENSQRGDKIIMGRHVTVYVPASAYKPVMREQLRSAFQEHYGDIVGVRLERKTTIGGADLYRPVVLILARAQ